MGKNARFFGVILLDEIHTGSQRDYAPSDKSAYNDAEAIAVTTYSSLFNTNPFFYNPQFIILDDAHASENYVVKFWSLYVSRIDHKETYLQILEIFRNSLLSEHYQRMLNDDPLPSDRSWVEKMPTTRFVERIQPLTACLDEYTSPYDELKYTWSVLRNHLRACHLYMSSSGMLIRPIIPPSSTHTPFNNADQRLYMSATLGLGGELERITGRKEIQRIKAPEGWDKHGVGRRLFFFPSTSLKEQEGHQLAVRLAQESPRSLFLLPDDMLANAWVETFVKHTDKQVYQAKALERTKTTFTNHQNAVAIFANRYDGINLVGDECRMQVMMGLPAAANLQERFLETRMVASILLQDRIRTRIVQALGRCTRSATDYSAVCILGDDLQDRLLQKENLKLFHPELQAELSFGNAESKDAKSVEDFVELYKLFLDQGSPEWRGADKEIIARRNGAKQFSNPLMVKLEQAVVHELSYQEAIWSANYEKALEKATAAASLLDGDQLKGYRGFWYYLAGSAAWLGSEVNPSLKQIARQRFQQAANCTYAVPWLRNLIDREQSAEQQEVIDPYLPLLIERLENELSRLGTTSDNKFDRRTREILEGLSSQTDGAKFERAHQELGMLLGYNAGNTEDTAGPDPWWIVGDFCLVAEDYTETDGTKPIPAYKIRQANDHSVWISRKVPGMNSSMTFVSVIISPSKQVETGALSISRDLVYWNQAEFVQWAHQAIGIIRSLRLDLIGIGDESWRIKAMQVYKEAGLDPLSIKAMLEQTPLTSLETTDSRGGG